MIVFLLGIITVVHLMILHQLTFTAWPEMLSYPYLLINHFALYKDFIMPYPPGLVVALAIVYKLFGSSVQTLILTTHSWIILTDLVFFLCLIKISPKNSVRLTVMIIYIVLQSILEGNMLWFDYATVMPLCLASFFVFQSEHRSFHRWLISAGLALGLAVLIKQIAIVYVVLAFAYFLTLPDRWAKLKSLSLGLALALVPFVIYLLLTGSLIDFWNWALFYPMTAWSHFPGYVQFAITRTWLLTLFTLAMPLLGLIMLRKKIFRDLSLGWLGLMLVAALIAVYPRFSFFHLQPTLAFLMLIFARIADRIEIWPRWGYLGLLVIAAVVIFTKQLPFQRGSSVRFNQPADQATDNLISSYVRPGQPTLLLNIFSSHYALTQTLPTKPWGDIFGWYLEIPGIQQWIIQGLKSERPEYIFRQKPITGNWFDLGVYEPRQLLDELKRHYERIAEKGTIEIWQRKR